MATSLTNHRAIAIDNARQQIDVSSLLNLQRDTFLDAATEANQEEDTIGANVQAD